jgi:hypothetical protein
MRHILLMLALAVSASGQNANPGGVPVVPSCRPAEIKVVEPDRLDTFYCVIDGRRAYLSCPDDTRQDCTLSVSKPKPSGHAVSTHTKAGK